MAKNTKFSLGNVNVENMINNFEDLAAQSVPAIAHAVGMSSSKNGKKTMLTTIRFFKTVYLPVYLVS